MASLADDGALSAWSPQTPLPDAGAFHSVVAYGEYIYLIGGRNESGYFDDVWFAYVYPDGRIESKWTKSGYTLPEGRASAAAFIHDGRIYLAGGEGEEGESGQLLSSKILSDGKPGIWAPEPMSLPSPRSASAALSLGDKVYLAGGKAGDAYLSDFLISEIGADGRLGPWIAGPSLPDARAFAALIPDQEAVAVLGGEDASGSVTAAYTLEAGPAWEGKPSFDGRWSGQGAVLRGFAFIPRPIPEAGLGDEESVDILPLSEKCAGLPTAKPAGGVIKKDATVALFAAADESIRYTIAVGGAEPPEPDESSPVYDPASRPAIGADSVLKARSFKAGLGASRAERLTFRAISTSLLYTVEKTVRPAPGYLACILQETYSGGTTFPKSFVWYELVVVERGWYSLSMLDKDDEAETYTDSVDATLFENNPMSLLRDQAAEDIFKRQDDFAVYLVPGSYSLKIASTSGTPGGSFALRFSTMP